MRKIFFIAVIILSIFASCLLFSCDSVKTSDTQEPVQTITYTVTFIEEGKQNVVITVESGKSLSDAQIPTITEKAGHTASWSITDFTNVTKNITVNAVFTPKSYLITFDLGRLKTDSYIQTNGATELTAVFLSDLVLPTPECYGYDFDGWALTDGGQAITQQKYTFTQDVTLFAIWQEDTSSGRWYTGEHS